MLKACSKGFFVVLLSLAPIAHLRAEGLASLNFEPIDSDFSAALDRIVFISASPNILHLYNPATNADTTIALPDTPRAMSIGPDGLHAAVAYATSVSYLDLQALTVAKTFSIPQGLLGVVLGTNYLYALGVFASGNTDVSINLITAQSTTVPQAGSGGGFSYRYNSLTNEIYGGFFILNSSTGPITGYTQGSICGRPWFSPDLTRVYDACGAVYSAGTNPSANGAYNTSFSGVLSVLGVASSATLNEVAVVPQSGSSATLTVADNQVLLYGYNYLNPRGRFSLPGFVVNGKSYPAHGRGVFFNNASSVLYVLMQADSTAGLTNDYALFPITVANPSACSVTLGANSSSPSDAGGVYTINLAADSSCVYQATASADWIQLSSNSYGSGGNTLTYQVRRNLTGSTRTGTISVEGATLVVTQAATSAVAELNPFSFKVIAADYSKAVDKLILVASQPNELHIFDGSTQTDQIVPLSAIPTAVSVSPNGTHAAVGHNGWVSYVNLQTAAVENVLSVPINMTALALAANGYVYPFSNNFGAGYAYSLNLATAAVTPPPNVWTGSWPVLTPSGKYLYTEDSKFDISSGPLALVNTYYTGLCGQFWISNDGARIYNACGNVFRSSDATAVDLTPNGSFPGTSLVNWAADSSPALHQVAVLTGTPGYNNVSTLEMFDDSSLNLISQETTPNFLVGGSYYTGYGRYAFWNSDSSKLYVIEQADPSSKLISDYGVAAVNTALSSSACTFTVAGGTDSVSAAGGAVTFSVTASAQTCNWSTYLPPSLWIALTGGASGTGNGTVTVAVAGYQSQGNVGFVFPRSGALTVAGQTVTVNQDPPCTYITSATNLSFFTNGGVGTLSITTGKGCPWIATSSQNWLTFNSPATGTGSGTFSYAVAANNTGAFESGVITVGLTANAFPPVQTDISVAAVAPPLGPLRFVPITPCRIADTRNASGSFGGPILSAGATRDFLIPFSNCGVPATAQAYSLNFTVVPPAGISYLTVWPKGQTQPNASLLNSDGRVKAVAAIVPAGAAGGVSVYSTDVTHVVLDINGYFVPAADTSALAFYPLTPCRIVDTRNAPAALGGPSLAAGETRSLPVTASSCQIPTNAQAYSLNFTVVPSAGLGYLAAWPAGQSQPLVSTLNAGHSPTANAAIVPAGTNGAIEVYASDATDLVLDIDGYFAPAANGGLSLYATTPCRPVDTRTLYQYPFGVINATFTIGGGACGAPATAQAYVLNVTAVPWGPLGFLSIWADGQSQPVVSTLNNWDAVVTSNMAIAPTNNGRVDVFASSYSHVILDLSGYFAP